MRNMSQLGLEAIRYLADEDHIFYDSVNCMSCAGSFGPKGTGHLLDCIHLQCKDFIERFDEYKKINGSNIIEAGF